MASGDPTPVLTIWEQASISCSESSARSCEEIGDDRAQPVCPQSRPTAESARSSPESPTTSECRRSGPGKRRGAGSCPGWTVIGRSVEDRSVKQRTPSAVVSSWTPPESVSTKHASASSPRNATYDSGPVRTRSSTRDDVPRRGGAAQRRSSGGPETRAGMRCRARASAVAVAERSRSSSTSAGRWRVTSPYSPGTSPSSRQGSGRAPWRRSPTTCRSWCCRRGARGRRQFLLQPDSREPPASARRAAC